MPVDLQPFLEPARCGVVVFECQENVIGRGSPIPGLAAAVRELRVLEYVAGLLAGAREAGASVYFCVAEPRAGGLGRAKTPISDRVAGTSGGAGPAPDTSIVKQLPVEPGDVVLSRAHGMSAFYDTGLDPCLRDRETRTVLPVGVSLNIGLLGSAIEAVNRGYRVIVPRDCVAGDPPEYGEQVLRYSLRNLAYLATAEQIVGHWGVPWRGPRR